jgi:hypothetical protein
VSAPNEDIPWDELFAALVPNETGSLASPTPMADLAARLRAVDEGASGDNRARLAPVLGLLAHCERLERERAERDHKANNALAGVHANVAFLESALGQQSPSRPLAEDATPEERTVLLQALRHAVQATRKLTDILRDPAMTKRP